MDSPQRTKADSGAVISEEQAQQWAAKAAAAGRPRPRILTGDRTTGKLHLGHYVGSLKHRVKYQGLYDTYILLADVQALTTHYDRPEVLKESVREVLLDYLAAGLDPYMGEERDGPDDGTKVKIVVQSMVPSIAELTVFYGLLVPTGLLRHNPTVKAEARQHGFADEDQELALATQVLGGRSEAELQDMDEANSKLQRYYPELGVITREELFLASQKALLSPNSALAEERARQGGLLQGALVEIPVWRRFVRDVMLSRRSAAGENAMPYGFLGYPISQAADITFIGAHLVPVGPDQVPLIELCREVVHRFNSQYSSGAVTGAGSPQHSGSGGVKPPMQGEDKKPIGGLTPPLQGQGDGGKLPPPLGGDGEGILTTPYALLGVREALQGLDGNAKMSKSLGNAIYLSETDEEIWAKVKVAPTDPQRMRRNDPGRPEVCNIFSYHKVFNGEKEPGIDEAALGVLTVEETAQQCRTAGIGCVDCKKNLCAKLKAILDPMRERRAQWEARPADLEAVLRAGTARANEEGENTLARVKAAMHMDYFKQQS